MLATEQQVEKWNSAFEKGDNQKLAKLLKQHHAAVSAIRNGKRNASVLTLSKIDKYYDKRIEIKQRMECPDCN